MCVKNGFILAMVWARVQALCRKKMEDNLVGSNPLVQEPGEIDIFVDLGDTWRVLSSAKNFT